MCQTTILPQNLDECIKDSVNASAKNDYGGFDEFTKMAMNKNEYTCENDDVWCKIKKKFDTWKYATEFQQVFSILNLHHHPPT